VVKFTPLRLHQMASVWRILSVLGIAMLALTPAGVWSLVAAAALFALCGASHGALGVTGPSTSTDPVPERHQGMAIGLFNGVSVGAMGVGAWLAGVLGQEFGFAVVLAISAGIMAAALWLHQRY
jgi:predicted MFS family arabinose efflux permease